MNLSKTLFWDTDPTKINYEKNARHIIERVVQRGTLNDWYEIKQHYGLDRIKNEVTQIRIYNSSTWLMGLRWHCN